jgi:hypothetical protein
MIKPLKMRISILYQPEMGILMRYTMWPKKIKINT